MFPRKYHNFYFTVVISHVYLWLWWSVLHGCTVDADLVMLLLTSGEIQCSTGGWRWFLGDNKGSMQHSSFLLPSATQAVTADSLARADACGMHSHYLATVSYCWLIHCQRLKELTKWLYHDEDNWLVKWGYCWSEGHPSAGPFTLQVQV